MCNCAKCKIASKITKLRLVIANETPGIDKAVLSARLDELEWSHRQLLREVSLPEVTEFIDARGLSLRLGKTGKRWVAVLTDGNGREVSRSTALEWAEALVLAVGAPETFELPEAALEGRVWN